MIDYTIITRNISTRFITIDGKTVKLANFIEILEELEGTNSFANALLIRSKDIIMILTWHKIISTNIKGSSGCMDEKKRKEWLDELYSIL